jgi:plastocyanin
MKKSMLVLLFIILFVLSACGGGGASTTIDVTTTDFMFTPDSFTVPVGKEITLNFTNNGAVAHDLVIFKLGTNPGDKFGPEDETNIFWKIQAQPGESKSMTFTAPAEPGEYYVTCAIPGHHEAGMNAKLILVADK